MVRGSAPLRLAVYRPPSTRSALGRPTAAYGSLLRHIIRIQQVVKRLTPLALWWMGDG
ncbi:MAG: hypothetical protein AAGG75_01910 [Bacteroidota bacterium]